MVTHKHHPRAPDLDRIRRYYDQTWYDYRILWLNPRNRAIHFGYSDENTRTHAESLTNMNRVLANRLGIQPGQRILDAGCGVGGSAIWLAKEYVVEVVGITPVASQIGRARRYARQQRVGHLIRFEQQDYLRTSFPKSSFDVIWALESACHAPDKRLFLAEARRVLRPGGRLGVAEYVRTGRPHADEALLHSWLSGWAIPNLATRQDWLEWTEATGFVEVQLADETQKVRPSLRRHYDIARILWPIALALHAVGLRSATQHGNSRGARDQYLALENGLWFYGMLTARVPGDSS